MGNMSYARFRNTLADLRDCQIALEEGALDSGTLLSLEEEEAAKTLIRLCSHISKGFDDINDFD